MGGDSLRAATKELRFRARAGLSRRARRAAWTWAGLEVLEQRLLLSVDPTPLEQETLELINRMRLDPAAELNILVEELAPITSADRDINAALKFFAVDGSALANQWSALTAAPPLAWNEPLYNAARGHNQLLIVHDRQSHQLPGEPPLSERAAESGYGNFEKLSENVFINGASVLQTHAAFVIDWGDNPPTGIQDPPVHRQNLMDPEFREIGISLTAEVDRTTRVGPLVVTHDLGSRSDLGDPYLLGVVYNDNDTDGFFDAGEGLSGVTIEIDGTGGQFSTTSLSAGGYQAQVPPGTYTVTFAGGQLSEAVVVPDVVIADENVKVDAIGEDIIIRFGAGLAKSVAFIDDDGTRAVASVRSATATLVFRGDNVHVQQKPKTVTVTGDHLTVAALAVIGSGPKTKLSIKGKGGDGLVTIDSATVDGAISRVRARVVDFVDALITVDGSIGRFEAHDLLNTTLTIGNGDEKIVRSKIRFSEAANFTVDSEGPVDIRGDRYVNDDPHGDGITATYVGRLVIKHDAAFAAALSGDGAPRGVSFKKARIGNFTGGTWDVNGAGGTFTADSFSSLSASFSDSVKGIESRGDITDTILTADSAATVKARANIVDSTFAFSHPFDPDDSRAMSLRKFKSGATVQNVVVRSERSVGTLEASRFLGVTIYAGVSDSVANGDLPADREAFEHETTIAGVNVRGVKDEPTWMNDTRFAAFHFGRIEAGFASANGGPAYGFAGVSFKRFTYKNAAGSQKLTGLQLAAAGETLIDPDLTLRVL